MGVLFAIFWPQFFFVVAQAAQLADQVTHRSAPVAQLAARGSHNPKVASSILVGSICLYSSVWQSMRLVSARSRVRSSLEAVRVGVIGDISACHAVFCALEPFSGSKPCY